MKTCAYFGQQNADAATHCAQCGTLIKVPQGSPSARPETRPLVLRILQPIIWITGGFAVITFWLLLTGQQRSGRVALECMLIFALAYYALLPFDPTRTRAVWAKYLMVFSGLIGVLDHIIRLMLRCGWLEDSRPAPNLRVTLRYTDLLLLLAVLVLLFSGQLLGVKRPSPAEEHKESERPPS